VVALHTVIAIVIAVGLIIAVKVDPVISLLLASLYLGLAAGVGFTGTIEQSPWASAKSWRKSGCLSGSVY
jgi:H+/gluconate symporter-like permease